MEDSSEFLRYDRSIYCTMDRMLASNPNAIILGEGVTDPTGVFGTTLNLVEKYGKERVLEMPIAEESIAGIALGASLNGLYPIVTHLRMDFILPCMNQIVNSIAKYKYMYGGTRSIPMLIRAVVGRSWGQGPQHSQSLHSILAHIPGLTVIMPSHPQDIEKSYMWAMKSFNGPVISIEHRLLYNWSFMPLEQSNRKQFTPATVRIGRDITLVAVSYMVQEAKLAAKWLYEKRGIECEIIDLFNLSDIDSAFLRSSLEKTGHLMVLDAGWIEFGIGAEIARIVVSEFPSLLKAPLRTLGMARCPAPTSHALEDAFYPSMKDIIREAYEVLGIKGELPSDEYVKTQYKTFKGPF